MVKESVPTLESVAPNIYRLTAPILTAIIDRLISGLVLWFKENATVF